MDRYNNRFLEPERGTGMIGWAVKQLVIWLVGGLVVYGFVNQQQFSGGASPDTAPGSAAVHASGPLVADTPSAEQLRPLGQSTAQVTNSLTLRARADGHVFLNAAVNGAPIPFIVDTGATMVALTHADALKAGVAGNLNYTISLNVANGVAKAAPVLIRQIRIGTLEVDNVEGMVVQGDAGISLLGQSFLKRLQGYEMHGGVLTLSWQ
jgi:aspartyl protease family protein